MAILQVCQVPRNSIPKVCHILEHKRRQKWAKTNSRLINEAKLDIDVIARLEVYARIRGSFSDILTHVRQLIGTAASREFEQACEEVLHVTSYLKLFGVLCHSCFDPLVVYNAGIGGTMFQLLIETANKRIDVIAAGGGYDNLVHRFQRTKTDVSAVGMHFALEVMIEIELHHERETGKHTEHDNSPQVLVCSTGREFLEARVQIATALWQHEIRADYMLPLMSHEDLHLYAATNSIPYLVILLSNQQSSSLSVKIYDTDSGIEFDVDNRQVTDNILALLHAKKIGDLKKQLELEVQTLEHYQQRATATASPTYTPVTPGGKRRVPSGAYQALGSTASTAASASGGGGGGGKSESGGNAPPIGGSVGVGVAPVTSGANLGAMASTNAMNSIATSSSAGGASTSYTSALSAALALGAGGGTHSTTLISPQSVIFFSSPNVKAKKKVVDDSGRLITPILRYCCSGDVKVMALDVSHAVLRELVACYDGTTFKFKSKLTSRHREHLDRFRDFMRTHQNLPLVVLYSIVDHRFEVLLLTRAYTM
jgi:histidyl-tRNA synthetase